MSLSCRVCASSPSSPQVVDFTIIQTLNDFKTAATRKLGFEVRRLFTVEGARPLNPPALPPPSYCASSPSYAAMCIIAWGERAAVKCAVMFKCVCIIGYFHTLTHTHSRLLSNLSLVN